MKDTPERHRVHRVFHLLLGLYAVACLGGFAIGFLASSGPVAGRLGLAMLGVFGGLVLMWLIALVLNVAVAVRRMFDEA